MEIIKSDKDNLQNNQIIIIFNLKLSNLSTHYMLGNVLDIFIYSICFYFHNNNSVSKY